MSVAFDFVHQVFKITVSVRIAIGKVNFVFTVLEIILPGQGVVRFVANAALAVPVFKVLNVLSVPMPADVLLLAFPFGVDDHLHSHFVQIVSFILV